MNRSLKMQLALGILSAAGCQLYASGRHSQETDGRRLSSTFMTWQAFLREP
jgi:hypothetical protein